mmetsp:Transcript_39463/g.99476  ORF Transcript_39463/g.99476 Transcript_39463/m.99476 type:complete len:260 (-) Transcript_39463:1520-2299(-)
MAACAGIANPRTLQELVKDHIHYGVQRTRLPCGQGGVRVAHTSKEPRVAPTEFHRQNKARRVGVSATSVHGAQDVEHVREQLTLGQQAATNQVALRVAHATARRFHDERTLEEKRHGVHKAHRSGRKRVEELAYEMATLGEDHEGGKHLRNHDATRVELLNVFYMYLMAVDLCGAHTKSAVGHHIRDGEGALTRHLVAQRLQVGVLEDVTVLARTEYGAEALITLQLWIPAVRVGRVRTAQRNAPTAVEMALAEREHNL